MKNCPNCHNQAKDDALFCPVCGTALDAYNQPDPDYFHREPVQMQMPSYTPAITETVSYDHSAKFEKEDIQNHKLVAMVAYLLNFVGVIIALLMPGPSDYSQFHIRQSLKITVLEVLITLASLLLCWTFIIPILGLIALTVLLVLRFFCFLDVCSGKAKDAPIIRQIKFLN